MAPNLEIAVAVGVEVGRYGLLVTEKTSRLGIHAIHRNQVDASTCETHCK